MGKNNEKNGKSDFEVSDLKQKQTVGPVSSGKLVPLPPDGGWGWVVVIGSFFIHVFADGFVYSFGVLVETLMLEFDASNTMSSLIISLLTGLTLVSGPLASAVCNKYGCRITTIAGAGIAFIGCALSYYASEMWHVVISVGVIMGIGFGLMYCPAIVIVTMYFEKRRSLATGFAVAGAGVGTVLFAPINTYLIATFGWRSVFLAFLFVLLLCALCGATFAPLEFTLVSDDDEEAEEIALLNPVVERSLSRSSLESQPKSRRGTMDSGYINRKDVFYTGSISNVPEFQERPDKFRSTGSLHAHSPATFDAGVGISNKEVSKPANIEANDSENHEGRNMFKTISNMLSLPLLSEPTFLLFAISNFLTSVGFNSPLYFLPLHATKIGLNSTQGAHILTAFGVFNTIGRVCFGVIADHKIPLPGGIGKDTARNRLWMYNISLAICGLLTTFSYMFSGYMPLIVYSALFGFSIASYICLTSVILVDLLGLDKLTNAFGLLLLWQGVATFFGPTVAGKLADITDNYTLSFVFCGINLLSSGLLLFGIPLIQQKKTQAAVVSKH